MNDKPDLELRERVATKVMGAKTQPRRDDNYPHQERYVLEVFVRGHGRPCGQIVGNGAEDHWEECPAYELDIAAAFSMQSKIPVELRKAYINKLMEIVQADMAKEGRTSWYPWEHELALASASPSQRCRAMLAAGEKRP